MTRCLTLADLFRFAEAAVGKEPQVRDFGLLWAAVAQSSATVFGEDVYPTVTSKAAALLYSLCGNHALVDGNTRLAWAATAVFLVLNGRPPRVDQDAVFDLVVAAGDLDDVPAVAERLERLCPRPSPDP